MSRKNPREAPVGTAILRSAASRELAASTAANSRSDGLDHVETRVACRADAAKVAASA
jgi:hypothetical protein